MTQQQEPTGDRQTTRLLRLSFPQGNGPTSQLLVNRLDAIESVSRDFRYTVELLSEDSRISLEEVHGKLLCVSLVMADGSLRPFTGHVAQFKLIRTDGGWAHYEAVLVPWFEFLRLRHNNRLFHDKTLQEQASVVLDGYAGVSKWEWKVGGEQRRFTMATQWDETDHNYLSRRMEAEGYPYWYEHTADGHTLMVFSDTSGAKPIGGQSPDIRFHSAGGPEPEEAIAHWSPARRWVSGQSAVSGFDFKKPTPLHASLPTNNQQGDVPPLEVYTYEGHYGFKDAGSADALAQLRMKEIEARGRQYEGRGNNRAVQPGRWFKLVEHFDPAAQGEFLILEVRHEVSNNYLQGVEVSAEYHNTFLCQSKAVPWHPGRNFNSINTRLLAMQTATVTGPDGQGSLHVDEYGRIKVKFHWDRDESSSCWVRVGSNWAGGQKGLSSHPRVGSEVIVQWLDGNPDHPLVTGSVHNQQYMPPWKLPDQRALMGMRSRELTTNGGNKSSGRSNHLVLDDTEAKLQAQLRSDHQASQLSLGHITRIEDNAGRKDGRGQGFELRTDGHGAMRAQRGLLISTESRPDARAHMTDMPETVERLSQGNNLHDSMSTVAQQSKAHASGDQDEVVKALKAQLVAVKGQGGTPAENEYPEYREPHLTLASPAGIQTSTQGSTHVSSAEHNAFTSGAHTSFSAGKSLLVSVKDAIRLFAHQTGMKLVAASADIDISALKDSVNLLAKLNITQTANRITITAKEEVVINGGTSFSRWNASGIVHGTSGLWKEQAGQHSLVTGSSEGKPSLPEPTQLPKGQLDLQHQYVNAQGATRQGVQQGQYTVTDSQGTKKDGALDARGFASVAGLAMGAVSIVFKKDQRNPWDGASYFGKGDAWPKKSAAGDKASSISSAAGGKSMLGALTGVAGSVKGLAGKFGGVAGMAKQAVGLVQTVKAGGAQGLLGQLGKTALGQVASLVPGGSLISSAISGGALTKGGAQALLGQAGQAALGQAATQLAGSIVPGGGMIVGGMLSAKAPQAGAGGLMNTMASQGTASAFGSVKSAFAPASTSLPGALPQASVAGLSKVLA